MPPLLRRLLIIGAVLLVAGWLAWREHSRRTAVAPMPAHGRITAFPPTELRSAKPLPLPPGGASSAPAPARPTDASAVP